MSSVRLTKVKAPVNSGGLSVLKKKDRNGQYMENTVKLKCNNKYLLHCLGVLSRLAARLHANRPANTTTSFMFKASQDNTADGERSHFLINLNLRVHVTNPASGFCFHHSINKNQAHFLNVWVERLSTP